MSDLEFRKKVYTYLIGGSSALLVTLLAFSLVMMHVVAGIGGVAILLFFAVVQMIGQLYFFLHLGDEKAPRWRTVSFAFVALALLILVIGSIWIMVHLNYNMSMTPEEMNKYMLGQVNDGF